MAGDLSHVVSIVVLFLRLKATGTPVGISLKTQELYLVVFLTRYLDLFTSFYSLYNTVMKIAYIAATAAIIAMVRLKSPWKFKYDRTQDAFLHWQFAVAPCAVLTPMYVLFHSGRHNWHMIEMLWTFSIVLEPVAIVPQLFVLQRFREVENLTAHYVFFLGTYRVFYAFNWVYRAMYEPFYHGARIVYICGAIQTFLYADFFYYYLKAKSMGAKVSLPMVNKN